MKFYKLTEADLPFIFQMNESELKVYCWLNVHLPFDDSKAIEIDTAQLAEEIGISRRSVQRALKSLESREIFDIEITKAKVKRMTTQMSLGDTDVAETTQMSPKRHRCRQNVTGVAKTSQVSPSQPEMPAQSEIQSPKTIKTIKTLSDLSEETREKFLAFCKRKGEQLPKPVVMLRKWIEKNFESLYSEYELVYGEENSAGATQNPVRASEAVLTPELEQAIALAKSEGKIRNIYWSSLHNCNCVVLSDGGAIIPITEWRKNYGAGYC